MLLEFNSESFSKKKTKEFNSESCDKLDGCPFSNKETKKQKQKKFNGCQETSYKRLYLRQH